MTPEELQLVRKCIFEKLLSIRNNADTEAMQIQLRQLLLKLQ